MNVLNRFVEFIELFYSGGTASSEFIEEFVG